ncbi:MAG: hypothetical protein JWM41_712 [Gemmatimonadetes bacterium]|nr:hypothetical protein [Gemmatimonadota bacterium]
MRSALLPIAAWVGVLQTVGPTEHAARLVGIASVLGTLTVLVYRLGVWRQEMEHTKHDVGGELKSYRESTTASFDRLERRLEAIDHQLALSADQGSRIARRQSRTERRLDRLESAEQDGLL